jgi:hypothetical protein
MLLCAPVALSAAAARQHVPDHHDNVQPEGLGSIFVQPPFRGQRVLLARLVFERAVDDRITHAVFRRLQRTNNLVSQPPQEDPPVPIRRCQQAAEVPLRDRPWSQACEPFDGGLLLKNRLADKQPAEDQVMPMVKHGRSTYSQ